MQRTTLNSPPTHPAKMQRFKLNDTAFILIDHQVGTNTWASTTPLARLQSCKAFDEAPSLMQLTSKSS
jgi:hypothetical protein